MKVTALIADDLVTEVQRVSGGKNITESITIALKQYLANQRLSELISKVESNPLQFESDFTSFGIRELNRNS